jgi:hypothetical protein
MAKPKGKTPSLLSMSTGKPETHVCGKLTPCSRCDEEVVKGGACFKIPKMKSGFTSHPIFCIGCTSDIIVQTNADIALIEAALKAHM